MKKYRLSVTRVTTYEVEAENENAALDVLLMGLAVEEDETTIDMHVEEIEATA